MNDDPLQPLRDLRQQLRYRAQKARREAEILVAKAETLEWAEIDLDIAIEKAAKPLTSRLEKALER